MEEIYMIMWEITKNELQPIAGFSSYEGAVEVMKYMEARTHQPYRIRQYIEKTASDQIARDEFYKGYEKAITDVMKRLKDSMNEFKEGINAYNTNGNQIQ